MVLRDEGMADVMTFACGPLIMVPFRPIICSLWTRSSSL